jgi:hypothetical protein
MYTLLLGCKGLIERFNRLLNTNQIVIYHCMSSVSLTYLAERGVLIHISSV